MDIGIFLILSGIIIYQAIEKYIDKKMYSKKEKELLNRIMTRNYGEFVKSDSDAKIKVVKVDDLLKDRDQEQGVPVY